MLKFFGDCLEKLCSAFAIIIWLWFTGIGAVIGYCVPIERISDIEYLKPLMAVLGGGIGFIISFFINILTFGFVANIISMRKSLEAIDAKLTPKKPKAPEAIKAIQEETTPEEKTEATEEAACSQKETE